MMATHIVTGQFRGNRVMAQKNRMIGQRNSDQNQEIEEKEYFKFYYVVYAGSPSPSSVYKQVHITKGAYTYARTFIRGKMRMRWEIKVK